MGTDMGNEQLMERVVLAKINARLLPLFFMVALLCQLDRSNLSFAALQMDPQLGFSKTIHGLGSGLFFIGYLAQLPANMACVAVGARRWLSGILVVWGCVAMCFAMVRGVALFLLLRLLLGVAESGAYPGMYYHLSLFYKDSHLGVAYTWVATATAIAGLLGGPLAAGLMSLDGKLGLRGWQWLFVVEGIPPLVLALVLFLRLPTSPLTAGFLESEERAWLWCWVQGRDDGIELAPVRLLAAHGELESAEEGGGAAAEGRLYASPDGGGCGAGSSGSSFSLKHTEEVERLFPRGGAAVPISESSQPGQDVQRDEQRWQQQSLAGLGGEASAGSAPASWSAEAMEGPMIEGAPLLDPAPNSGGFRSRAWEDNPALAESAHSSSHAAPGSHARDAAVAAESDPERAAAQFKAPRVDEEGGGLSRHILRQGLTDWRVWWLGGVMFSVDFAMNSTHFWLPMLIKGMLPGYEQEDDEDEAEGTTSRQAQLHQVVAASLLAALPFAGAGVCMVANAYSAKRHRERRLHTAIPLGVAGCAFGLVVPLSHWLGLWPALVSLTLAAAGIWATHGPLFSWPAQFLEPRAGALAFALMKTLGALGGFSGPLAVGVLADEDQGFGGAMLLLAVVCGVTGAVVAVFPPENRPAGKPQRLRLLLRQLSRSLGLVRYDQLAL